MEHLHTNHLINETSPYLLQHAHNPVNWYGWGEAALQKAKTENKVILVSIGYSACHWCHVMERESFEDEATAQIMNDHFVNIKIDREERPDIDHIYMDAVQAITGSGGWPLNVFLTPDAMPFYGGTYFPPVNAFNRPSWKEVLNNIRTAWSERRNEIASQAENLRDYLNKAANFTAPIKDITGIDSDRDNDFQQFEKMFSAIMQTADQEWGGFGKAPKFPQTFTIQFLLQFYHYSGNETALQQALLSIDKMLNGGIYDHVAGGLARYSTDEEWLAPHFEKMLYDNALLIIILCDAYQVTRQPKYKEAIEKTITFIQQELTHQSGGFYAALDADSEGEEGKYYVWQKSAIEGLLKEDAPLFCDFFNVTEEGNWEEKNILRILKPLEFFVKERQLKETEFKAFIKGCLLKLDAERSKRTKPGLDDKILLGWNALMMKAIAKAAIVLQNDDYGKLAITNLNFILERYKIGEQLCPMHHTWKNGVAKYPAFLDDYAFLADALLQLYEVSFDTVLLDRAKTICEHVMQHFGDAEGVFFYYTNDMQNDVIIRKKEIYDGATPSANATIASVLLKLSIIYDIPAWQQRVDKMLATLTPSILKYPGSFGVWASVLLQKNKGTSEIAVVGHGSSTIAKTIQAAVYLPHKILMATDTTNDLFPVLKEKATGNPALIYLCRQYSCLAPFRTPADFLTVIYAK